MECEERVGVVCLVKFEAEKNVVVVVLLKWFCSGWSCCFGKLRTAAKGGLAKLLTS